MKQNVRDTNKEKRKLKYEYTISLLVNGYTIKDATRLSNLKGIKMTEQTCRTLRREFVKGESRY